MEFPKKVNVKCLTPWSHHHSGWPFCVNALRRNLHSNNGVIFQTNSIVSEILLSEKPLRTPWIGVLHATPEPMIEENLRHNPSCLESLSNCKGIFVLSDYVARFVTNTTNVLCHTLRLAVEQPKFLFDKESYLRNPNKRTVCIGHWMRKHDSVYKLQARNHRNTILRCTNQEYPTVVDVIQFLPPDQYEKLFINNIVFLDLVDSSANNTVIECIVRNTPILINRLPALEEYLGMEYPLFYHSLEEASEKGSNESLILQAHHYLAALDKSQFQEEFLVASVANSKIYLELP